MENATKALLIAAAVLVAILIISLGLAVYNKASNATDSADLSATEIQAQNEKFLKYEGKNRRGSEVNALLETVKNSNLTANSEGAKVKVEYTGKSLADDPKETNETLIIMGPTCTTEHSKVDKNKQYKVVFTRDSSSGIINLIQISDK